MALQGKESVLLKRRTLILQEIRTGGSADKLQASQLAAQVLCFLILAHLESPHQASFHHLELHPDLLRDFFQSLHMQNGIVVMR